MALLTGSLLPDLVIELPQAAMACTRRACAQERNHVGGNHVLVNAKTRGFLAFDKGGHFVTLAVAFAFDLAAFGVADIAAAREKTGIAATFGVSRVLPAPINVTSRFAGKPARIIARLIVAAIRVAGT